VRRVFEHVEQLVDHPRSGSVPPELRPLRIYRQIIEPPCRVIYRMTKSEIFIVHVIRGARQLKRSKLRPRKRQ
jgi:plasmid stabilization system protein ParE